MYKKIQDEKSLLHRKVKQKTEFLRYEYFRKTLFNNFKLFKLIKMIISWVKTPQLFQQNQLIHIDHSSRR